MFFYAEFVILDMTIVQVVKGKVDVAEMAIKVWHDQDNNGKVSKNWTGWPRYKIQS